jgi:hypothetical protein
MGKILLAVSLAGMIGASLPGIAHAAPTGMAGIGTAAPSNIVETAACARHYHFVPAHRDRHGHRIRGRCVRNRR